MLDCRRQAVPGGGFTLQETLVASVIASLVIGGASVFLVANQRRMQGSSGLALARDSNTTSLALVRADVIRGTQLLFRQGTSTASDNLDGVTYRASMTTCQLLAGSDVFNPVFGIRQNSLTPPVIYGLGIARNGTSYALQRCGPPLAGSGSPVLRTVLEGIAPVPCADGRRACPPPVLDPNGNATDLRDLLLTLSHTLGADNTSPSRVAREPAFRFRTDALHRLIELIDPTGSGDGIDWSFTSADPTGVSQRAPLYLTARLQSADATRTMLRSIGRTCTNCSFYGLPIAGTRLYFILDGSYTMSACTTWAGVNDVNPNGERRTYWDPTSTSGNPANAWITTSRVCLTTRMQSLQVQMRQVLQSLPSSTQILLVAYSSGTNNRSWPSNNVLATIGTGTNRTDAIAFIDSLDDGDPRLWGDNTRAWNPLLTAYKDVQSDAVYLVADGLPDLDYYSRPWQDTRYQDSIQPYVNFNKTRTKKLSLNSIVIGFQATWMREFSYQSYGTYLWM